MIYKNHLEIDSPTSEPSSLAKGKKKPPMNQKKNRCYLIANAVQQKGHRMGLGQQADGTSSRRDFGAYS